MCVQVNLAVMLNAINHTKSALMFLENALQVNKKYVQCVSLLCENRRVHLHHVVVLEL